MSRIGRMPITVPAGVTVNVAEGNVVTVKGPKGELTQSLRPEMIIKQEGTTITVERPSDDKLHRSVHGLTRTLLHNMVVGVTEGFKKELDVNGVGYRVAKEGTNLVMNRAPISRRWASLRQKSAKSVPRSRIRARVSNIPTRSSAARLVRPAPRSKEVCRNDY